MPVAGEDPTADLMACNDVIAEQLGDGLSDDPEVAAQQIARGSSGFMSDRAYVEAHGLSGARIELTAEELQRVESGSLQDAAVSDLIQEVVMLYASQFQETFGVAHVSYWPEGTGIVVSFTDDVDTHAEALQDLIGGQAPLRVVTASAASRDVDIAGQRVLPGMGRPGSLIVGVGVAAPMAGEEVRAPIMVSDLSDAAREQVQALLEEGEDRLVCLLDLGPAVGLGPG